MSTGKDYGLPEEYADWERWDGKGDSDGREYISVTIVHNYPNNWTKKTGYFHLRAPKPKPTLPDVRPGAVVRFRSKAGSIRRAIRSNGGWHVFESGSQVVYGFPRLGSLASDNELLRDVNDDGFTIELEGLG